MANFVRNLEDVAAVRDIRDHLNHRRVFRVRQNPFEIYNNCEFRQRYRLTKDAVRYVIGLIEDELSPLRLGQKNITPSLQVLIALRYYAKGCYQLELGK